MQKEKQHVMCIVGPTASGKTSAAIAYAKKYNGYIISADSRQLYRGMDIGTAKPHGSMQQLLDSDLSAFMVGGIPHFMIDIVDPDTPLTLADFQTHVYDLLENKKLNDNYQTPLLVGGTGLYIQSIVDNYFLPSGEPDHGLRNDLEKKSLTELQKLLQKKDPQSFVAIDTQNPRRIIRALEYTLTTGESYVQAQTTHESPYTFTLYGIQLEKDTLHTRIDTRVDEMINNGLIEEVEMLYKAYGHIQTLETIGYAEIIDYLEGTVEKEKAIDLIKLHTRQYAKRQMTWFQRDKRIQWIKSLEAF